MGTTNKGNENLGRKMVVSVAYLRCLLSSITFKKTKSVEVTTAYESSLYTDYVNIPGVSEKKVQCSRLSTF